MRLRRRERHSENVFRRVVAGRIEQIAKFGASVYPTASDCRCRRLSSRLVRLVETNACLECVSGAKRRLPRLRPTRRDQRLGLSEIGENLSIDLGRVWIWLIVRSLRRGRHRLESKRNSSAPP